MFAPGGTTIECWLALNTVTCGALPEPQAPSEGGTGEEANEDAGDGTMELRIARLDVIDTKAMERTAKSRFLITFFNRSPPSKRLRGVLQASRQTVAILGHETALRAQRMVILGEGLRTVVLRRLRVERRHYPLENVVPVPLIVAINRDHMNTLVLNIPTQIGAD